MDGSLQRSRRRGVRFSRRPRLVPEVLLLVGLFLIYRLGRLAITGHDDLAIDNAWHIWDLERLLRFPDEEALQDWLLHWPGLVRGPNWYHVAGHYPATLPCRAWGWLRHPLQEYRWARRLIITLTARAPVQRIATRRGPPRMLPT